MSSHVATAVRLAEEERDHLIRPAQHLRGTLGVPAFFVSRRRDILGWNRLATIVFGDCARLPPGERNAAR